MGSLYAELPQQGSHSGGFAVLTHEWLRVDHHDSCFPSDCAISSGPRATKRWRVTTADVSKRGGHETWWGAVGCQGWGYCPRVAVDCGVIIMEQQGM